jgi:hypothetical protein
MDKNGLFLLSLTPLTLKILLNQEGVTQYFARNLLKINYEIFVDIVDKLFNTKHENTPRFQLKISSESDIMDNNKLTCDGCQSENIIMDHATYHYVCRDCGMVQMEFYEFYFPPIAKRVEGNYNPVLNGTNLGYPKERKKKYQNLQSIQRYVSSFSSESPYHLFRELAAYFDIKIDIGNFVHVFEYIYSKMPKYSIGKNIKALSAVIFIQQCNVECIVVSQRNILEIFSVSESQYREILKLTFSFFKKKYKPSNYRLIKKMVLRGVEEFRLPPIIIDAAIKLIDEYTLYLGTKLRVKAACALSIAIQLCKVESFVKIYHISKLLKVSASTIYSHAKYFFESIPKEELDHIVVNLKNQIN